MGDLDCADEVRLVSVVLLGRDAARTSRSDALGDIARFGGEEGLLPFTAFGGDLAEGGAPEREALVPWRSFGAAERLPWLGDFALLGDFGNVLSRRSIWRSGEAAARVARHSFWDRGANSSFTIPPCSDEIPIHVLERGRSWAPR